MRAMVRGFRCAMFLLLWAACALLSACAPALDAAPVVKIGLIAPFEGVGRPLGYALLPAVRAVLAEANAGGLPAGYRVALVALDDSLDSRAAADQAAALAQDGDVMAVLGPWSRETAAAAVPILSRAGIPVVVAAPLASASPGVQSLCPDASAIGAAIGREIRVANEPSTGIDSADAINDLLHRYTAGWRGVAVGGPDLARPWFVARAGEAATGALAALCQVEGMSGDAAGGGQKDAVLAHEAALAGAGARRLLQALARDIRDHGTPSRQGIAAALAAQPVTPAIEWYELRQGSWMPR